MNLWHTKYPQTNIPALLSLHINQLFDFRMCSYDRQDVRARLQWDVTSHSVFHELFALSLLSGRSPSNFMDRFYGSLFV